MVKKWSWRSQETDEGEFGFTYSVADQILYGLYDKKMKPKQLLKYGIKLVDINRVMKWVEKNEFKHDLPITFSR